MSLSTWLYSYILSSCIYTLLCKWPNFMCQYRHCLFCTTKSSKSHCQQIVYGKSPNKQTSSFPEWYTYRWMQSLTTDFLKIKQHQEPIRGLCCILHYLINIAQANPILANRGWGIVIVWSVIQPSATLYHTLELSLVWYQYFSNHIFWYGMF